MSSDEPGTTAGDLAALHYMNERFTLGDRLEKLREEMDELRDELTVERERGNPNEHVRPETLHELADVAVVLDSLRSHPKLGPLLRVALRQAYGRLCQRIVDGEFEPDAASNG